MLHGEVVQPSGREGTGGARAGGGLQEEAPHALPPVTAPAPRQAVSRILQVQWKKLENSHCCDQTNVVAEHGLSLAWLSLWIGTRGR